jgi:hypothetical protein
MRGRDERLRTIAITNATRKAAAVPPASVPVPPSAPVLGRASRVVLNSGECVQVHYAVVEADWLITSHSGLSYDRDPRYPVEAQPRDYGAEFELQLAVESRAANLDPWQLLTDSVLPVDGPPVVRKDGVVISGNGRVQSMRLAMTRGLYREVSEGIIERAGHFRLDVETLREFSRPVLIRLMDEDVTDRLELARYGIEMNRDPGQGMSSSEQSIGLARLMTRDVASQLSDLVATLPEGYSVRDFMRLRARDIAMVLSVCGLVDARKRAAYFTEDGELTEVAKDLVETTLAGLTVTDISVLRGASRPTRDRLVRAGVEFMRMRNAGKQWDLAGYNNEAVELVSDAEDRASYLRTLKPRGVEGSGSLVERLLHPERFLNHAAGLGFGERAAVHPAVEALAMALELNPRDYVAAVREYARRACGAWRSMFECLQPAEVFTETIGTRRDAEGRAVWVVHVAAEQWHLPNAA